MIVAIIANWVSLRPRGAFSSEMLAAIPPTEEKLSTWNIPQDHGTPEKYPDD